MNAVNNFAKNAADLAYSELLQHAYEEGRKAGIARMPVPMIVGHEANGGGIDYSKPVYFVDDGACGFGWVNIRPGNSPFANWLKKRGIARPSYHGGVDIWISEFGQSVERKAAMADAMAKVFRDAGINAYGSSRMD